MTRDRLLQVLEAARPGVTRARMISVRFLDTEFRRLKAMAKTHGVAPATLARLLIMTGLEDLEGGK